MNQILSIDGNGKDKRKKTKEPRMRNSGPLEIKTIVRFFAIAILVFGVFMIGTGSYSMYKNSQEEAAKIKPTINIARQSNQLTLTVTHNRSLSQIAYSWNDGQQTQINAEGKKNIEQTIDIPSGTNKLTVYATDITGLQSKYEGQYELKTGIEINIESQNPNIKITANSENQLSFMTYRWDEEDEIKVDINDVKIEQVIEVPEGKHTLTVAVVDINNNQEIQVQEVEGVRNQGNDGGEDEHGKPQVAVTVDNPNSPENFVINATDEVGIKKVEFVINETDNYGIDYEKARPSIEDRKTFEFQYPLEDGENKLEIRVYNQNDQVTIEKVKFTK